MQLFPDVEAEIVQLKRRSSNSEDRGHLVSLLRQALVEEQLLSSDLKRKLQLVKNQNLSLSQQLQEIKSQPGSPHAQQVMHIHCLHTDLCFFPFSELTKE